MTATGELSTGVFLRDWHRESLHRWTPSTARFYGWLVDQTVGHLGDVPLIELSADHLRGHFAAAGGRVVGGTDALSASTMARRHSVLRTALGDAVRWGLIKVNPAELIAFDRVSVGRALDSAGVIRLVRAGGPGWFGTLLRLAAVTGARRGELCALRRRDIDVERSQVLIARAMSIGENATIVEGPTKTRTVRVVSIDPVTLTRVLGLVDEDQELNPFVFRSRCVEGRPVHPGTVTEFFGRLRRHVAPDGSLSHVRFGDLRHFAVSGMLEAGVPVSVVSRRIGHATPVTTLRTYNHMLGSPRPSVADVLAAGVC